MTQVSKTARRTKAPARKGANMTQAAKPARKPAAKKAAAPAPAMPQEAPVVTKAYAAFIGKKQMEGQVDFTMKEARKLLWREAKRLGLTDAATPREFFAGAVKGGGNWEVKAGKKAFIIKEFVVEEVAA